MNEDTHADHTPTSSLPFKADPNESPEAFEGFLTYMDLGQDRTLEKVAELLGVHFSTVKGWSSDFQWRNRIRQYRLTLLDSRQKAEQETQKAHELAKAERQKHEELEIEAIAREIRGMARNFYKDYTLHGMDKTRLDEITRLLLASVRLPHIAAAATAAAANSIKKESKAADTAPTPPYLDAIRKTYGPKTPPQDPPPEPPQNPDPPKTP